MNQTNRMLWLSVKRALGGQTPPTMRALSFKVDHANRSMLLRAHFGSEPTEDDLEDISVVEFEVATDFLDRYDVATDIVIARPGPLVDLLADGVAYLCAGEPGAEYFNTDQPA